MNYINPTHNAFIVPQGTLPKRKKESENLKKQKALIKSYLVKKDSKEESKVYNFQIGD